MPVFIELSSAGDPHIQGRHFVRRPRAELHYSIPWRARSRDEKVPSAGAQIRSSGRRSVNPFFDDRLTYSDGVVVFGEFTIGLPYCCLCEAGHSLLHETLMRPENAQKQDAVPPFFGARITVI